MTIKYTGKHGEYLFGIPARNLTDEEWSDLTKEQRKAAIDSGLYLEPGDKTATAKETRAVSAKVEADTKPGG